MAPGPAPAADTPLSWEDVQALPVPTAGERIAYGAAPSQFGDLRLPRGPGPHAVVVLLHGGCWWREFDLSYLAPLADALVREAAVATWNLEFRRIGEPGGGWPGTLDDAARGTDHLRRLAAAHALDLSRVVGVGHSAGGQLALWLAARAGEDASAALPLRGAIGLSAITDLAAYGDAPGGCNAAVRRLIGGSPREQPGRYAAASPIQRLPLGIAQWLIHGAADPIVPADFARRYAQRARASGDRVQLRLIDGAGHFEPVVPAGAAWQALLNAVRTATGGAARAPAPPPEPR